MPFASNSYATRSCPRPSVAPCLIVDGADRSIAFAVQALGAQGRRRIVSPTGGVMHAKVRIDETVVMLGDSAPGWPPVASHVHVYVRDVDVAYQCALAAGAVSIQEPVKIGDDDKRGGVRYPGRNHVVAGDEGCR